MKLTMLFCGVLLPMLFVQPCCSMATIRLGRQSSAPMELGIAETISVEVSGILAGDRVVFVATTVEFDGRLLGTPTITAGPLVPDETGFTSAMDIGFADAVYDVEASSTDQSILSDGVFYTFDVVPTEIGSGELSIAFADLIGTSANGNDLGAVVIAPSLPFEVIPEPKSISWWGVLIPFGFWFSTTRWQGTLCGKRRGSIAAGDSR